VIKDRLAAGELDGPDPVKITTVSVLTEAEESDRTDGTGAGTPSTRRSSTRKPAKRSRGRSVLDIGETSVSMTVEDLVNATGLSATTIGELERYGLVTAQQLGGTAYYDEDALLTARLAATFLRHGVEPRHLRMYKVSAEREAGVFEQLAMPTLRQRDPGARQEAVELLGELSELGDQLRGALLRQALRQHLGPV
jgi:DNA-binding transcriptional MerR regulator